jgi:hypothetical protein
MKDAVRINIALTLILGTTGCATTAAPPQPRAAAPPPAQTQRVAPNVTRAPLTYTPEVRKLSGADDRPFSDMSHAIGGVDFYDRVQCPQATTRTLVRIDVIVPYSNHQTHIERWTIQHDGEVTASYIARFMPDGKGGTNFAVGKDTGKVTP